MFDARGEVIKYSQILRQKSRKLKRRRKRVKPMIKYSQVLKQANTKLKKKSKRRVKPVIKYSQILKQTSINLRKKSKRSVQPIVEVCGERLEALSQSQSFILRESSIADERSKIRQRLKRSLSQIIWDDLGLSDNVEVNTINIMKQSKEKQSKEVISRTEPSREERIEVETNIEYDAKDTGMDVSVIIDDTDNSLKSIELFVTTDSMVQPSDNHNDMAQNMEHCPESHDNHHHSSDDSSHENKDEDRKQQYHHSHQHSTDQCEADDEVLYKISSNEWLNDEVDVDPNDAIPITRPRSSVLHGLGRRKIKRWSGIQHTVAGWAGTPK